MGSVRRRIIPAILLLMMAGTALAQSRVLPPPTPGRRPDTPWWKNEQFQKDLGLTGDQITRIDNLWQTTQLDLRHEWDEVSH